MTPLWEAIFALFSIFVCFCGTLFLRVVLEGFRDRFRVDFGMILEGNFADWLYIFLCTLHIAKSDLDMVFTMFEAQQRFQNIFAKMRKSANSDELFSETRPERILESFWEDFRTIFGGFGAPKSEKMG